ncbi:TRAP transporter substrate-binding protein [Paracidovorax citrulli]
MQRRGLLKTMWAGGLMAGIMAMTAAPVQAQVKWDLPTGYPVNNPHTANLEQLVKDVNAATQGKLVITLHPNGSLFKANEIKRAVQSNQAQMGEVLMSLLENENPLFGLDAVPFLATGFDASYKLWQAQRPVVERVLDRQNIKLLYAVAWPPQGIYAKKEIRSAADMKGLKWRAYNPATTKIAQAVGAQPMTIQAAELSQALATGVVDSFMSSGATGVDSKVWESLTHFHTVDAWLPKNMVVVNKREFEKLDKASQEALLKASSEAEKRGWQNMRGYTQQSLDTLAKNKMTVVKPTPQLQADMKKIGDELLAEWEKKAGADGKEIIAAYRK